jgi:hypothetical protein
MGVFFNKRCPAHTGLDSLLFINAAPVKGLRLVTAVTGFGLVSALF